MPANQPFNIRICSIVKTLLLIAPAVSFTSLSAQQMKGFSPEFSVNQSTLISTGEDLPFWMTTDSNGAYSLHNQTYLLFQAGLKRKMERDSLKKWGYSYGGNMVCGLAGAAEFHPNEYWLGIRFQSIILKAGAESDPVIYSGLSSTNGNMYRSRNARPVPGLSLSTNGFLPLFLGKKWFSYRFLYEEGVLNDQGVVSKVHLHRKNFYLKGVVSSSLSLSLGIEHYVFWGGNSPVFGQQPTWNQYFRYVFGRNGGAGATGSDQINRAGNQLGSYNLELKKEFRSINAVFYWNHPFEDHSGMELVNISDGLWGIHLAKKDRGALITNFVYEYLSTLNQSGPVHLEPAPTPENPSRRSGRGQDDYFNHMVYTSGYTYYHRMMGTPLFVPEIGNGTAKAFESTRMWMHHFGFGGFLNSRLSWKSLMTWSRNFGTYLNAYPNPLDEFSFLGECRYVTVKLPFEVKAGMACDIGDRFERRFGAYLGIGFHF